MEENFYLDNELEFEDKTLQGLISNLKECFEDKQKYFVKLCKTIYNIWSYCKNNYWKAKNNEYYNSYKLLAKFGFSKTAVCRLKNCYERFCNDRDINIQLKDIFKDFSPSKLYELLPLKEELIYECVNKNIISAKMSKKEIRQIVKDLVNGVPVDKISNAVVEIEEINEEEIPMVYDPKQNYEFEYFKSKSKNQLLNMIWDLQKEYQESRNKKVEVIYDER